MTYRELRMKTHKICPFKNLLIITQEKNIINILLATSFNYIKIRLWSKIKYNNVIGARNIRELCHQRTKKDSSSQVSYPHRLYVTREYVIDIICTPSCSWRRTIVVYAPMVLRILVPCESHVKETHRIFPSTTLMSMSLAVVYISARLQTDTRRWTDDVHIRAYA